MDASPSALKEHSKIRGHFGLVAGALRLYFARDGAPQYNSSHFYKLALADRVEAKVIGLQSKKRGLSLEEKRKVLLSVFHEDPQPYMLKASAMSRQCSTAVFHLHVQGSILSLQDVEKIASKRGVVLQSVKEVLQASLSASNS